MSHAVTREMRRAFCGDDHCDGLHQEPYAVCTCGWRKWVGDLPTDATATEERRVYESARDEHLTEAAT